MLKERSTGPGGTAQRHKAKENRKKKISMNTIFQTACRKMFPIDERTSFDTAKHKAMLSDCIFVEAKVGAQCIPWDNFQNLQKKNKMSPKMRQPMTYYMLYLLHQFKKTRVEWLKKLQKNLL